MKVNLIAYSYERGGAALAAKRFANLLPSEFNVDLIKSDSEESTNKAIGINFLIFAKHFFKRLISYALLKLMKDKNPIKHSLNLFSSTSVLTSFNQIDSGAVYNLHWINNDTLSIFKLKLIPRGSIITLHDEWLYCGAEHCYDVYEKEKKFISGYSYIDKSVRGVNWNFIIWKIKQGAFSTRQDLIFTVPSSWMLERAKKSLVLFGKDIRLLPNPIDIDLYFPLKANERQLERDRLDINKDDIVLCIGSFNDSGNKLKGGKKAAIALKYLEEKLSSEIAKKICIVTFGASSGTTQTTFRQIDYGFIHSPEAMRKLYSIADCSVVPSLVESFGQVAAESLSCKVPVICFNASGLKDIVSDGINGFVAKPYDPSDLAECICKYIYTSCKEKIVMRENARHSVEKNFSTTVVREKYLKIINDAKSKASNS